MEETYVDNFNPKTPKEISSQDSLHHLHDKSLLAIAQSIMITPACRSEIPTFNPLLNPEDSEKWQIFNRYQQSHAAQKQFNKALHSRSKMVIKHIQFS